MVVDELRERNLTPFRLAVLYLAFGFVALFASDVLLLAVFEDPLLRTLQAGKGALEVFVTAVLIYLVVRSSWRDLLLKERAIDAAPIGITMSDPDREDNPLVFANSHFEELTGYDESEAIGRNCRFLQGEATDPETRAELREAIDDDRPVSVDVVNYRRNGERFWNKVDVAPVRDGEGAVTAYVGFQADITGRKIREERFEVLLRVLRHNFRNKINVVDGYLDMLAADYDGQPPESLERVERAVEDLISLTETARRNETILHGAATSPPRVRLDRRLPEVVAGFRDRYPEATLDLHLPADGPVEVRVGGLLAAIEEAIENAIEHNERSEPTVAVRVETHGDGWVEIEIEDDGPGIPGPEVDVLSEGETQLKHADRLGLWSIYWIVARAGGSLEVTDADGGGSVIALSVPAGAS